MAMGSDSSPGNKWQHPPSFYCPISQQVMHDPVVLSDGHTYERRHIERWLSQHSKSPVSGVQLQQNAVFPNHALRNAIEEYFQQIFSVHRRAIRKTIHGPESEQSLDSNASLLRTIDALMQCSMLINADLDTEYVLRQIMDEAKMLVGAEVASVFLVDENSQELYSNVNSTGSELRIPISVGIAGHVATTGELLVIRDAYHDERFNKDVDVKTGFKTRNMICAPLTKSGSVLGVVQLINKTGSGLLATDNRFGTLSPDFTADDVQFLKVFAAQASTAISNSSGYSEPVQRKVSEKLSNAHQFSDDLPCTELMLQCFGKRKERSSVVRSPTSTGEHLPSALSGAEKSTLVTEVEELLTCTGPALELLSGCFDAWHLDTLALAKATGNRPLSMLSVYLFDRLDLVSHFGLRRPQLIQFFTRIEQGYDDAVNYHNRAHAASVVHIMHSLLQSTGLARTAAAAFKSDGSDPSADGSGKLECMACLIAAAIHDYEHLGLSNDFLSKTADARAIRHNDQHINENHHLAAAFAVLYLPECNFLSNLPSVVIRRLRSLIIDLVIGTDMANNGKIVSTLTEALDSFFARQELEASDVTVADSKKPAFLPRTPREAVTLLQTAMKCADLGHLTLPWDLHLLWVRRLESEFFAQGDRERELGLPVSFLMDRGKPGASETQGGFFDFVVLPLFGELVRAVPAAEPVLLAVKENHHYWMHPDARPECKTKHALQEGDATARLQRSWTTQRASLS
eukprot:TRINITY_DN77553_c0_g1_i1.p1 TRINITY_DN77553_c0_g1~~TRINITY_DN77553_c0_g1_i1.p1  ORF type:complete len:774 (+),score=150.41 TRINITY_DN77553_c0_g1_i1:102-2324(+)